MKVFSHQKRLLLSVCIICLFSISSQASAQTASDTQSLEQHLYTQLDGFYDVDQPEFYHNANMRIIQKYAATLANADLSLEGVDDYSKTFFIEFTGNQIVGLKNQFITVMGSLVAPTLAGFSTYAIAENLINPKLSGLGRWLVLEKEEQILLNNPAMFDRYMKSKTKLFKNLDEVLHYLINGSFFIQHEGSSYILGLKSTQEKVILNRQRFVKLLSLLMVTPQDKASSVASNFFNKARSGYITTADFIPNAGKSVATKIYPTKESVKSAAHKVPFSEKAFKHLPKVIALTAAIGTLAWMESSVFTNEFDPDANPGLFEIGSLDVFLHQVSQAIENKDPAELQSTMNQYPILTAITAKEILTIQPAIKRYQKLVENL